MVFISNVADLALKSSINHFFSEKSIKLTVPPKDFNSAYLLETYTLTPPKGGGHRPTTVILTIYPLIFNRFIKQNVTKHFIYNKITL